MILYSVQPSLRYNSPFAFGASIALYTGLLGFVDKFPNSPDRFEGISSIPLWAQYSFLANSYFSL